jgi:heme/copper-type cytochrome/quinol oxidase subunit 2
VSSRKARGVSNDSNGFIVLCVRACVVVVVVVVVIGVVVFRRRRRRKKRAPTHEILANEKAFASFS